MIGMGPVHRLLKGMILRHGPRMITCREFEDFVLDYLDGELSTGKRRVFELHLKLCRECRDYLAAYRRSVELGGAMFRDPEAQVPADVPEDLIQAILDARDA